MIFKEIEDIYFRLDNESLTPICQDYQRSTVYAVYEFKNLSKFIITLLLDCIYNDWTNMQISETFKIKERTVLVFKFLNGFPLFGEEDESNAFEKFLSRNEFKRYDIFNFDDKSYRVIEIIPLLSEGSVFYKITALQIYEIIIEGQNITPLLLKGGNN